MNNPLLKELAQHATQGAWQWATSNSHNRLSSVSSGKDGDVISAFTAVDGVPCVSVSHADMAFIEAAHPSVVIELIECLEAAEAELARSKEAVGVLATRKARNAIDPNEPEAVKNELLKRADEASQFADGLKNYPVLPGINFDPASGPETTIFTYFAVPPGWTLVPNTPSPRQWAAGLKAMQSGTDKVTLVYRAMVATAPTPRGGDVNP